MTRGGNRRGFDTDRESVYQRCGSSTEHQQVLEIIPDDYAGVLVRDRESYEAKALSQVEQSERVSPVSSGWLGIPFARSLNHNLHRCVRRHPDAQLECGGSLESTCRHTKVYLVPVHRAGKPDCTEHFRGSAIHPHFHR